MALPNLLRRPPILYRAVRRALKEALRWRFRDFAPDARPTHPVKVAGLRLIVLRGVFDPGLHFTSAFLAGYLRSPGVVSRGTRVADVGTGSGLQAIISALAGAGQVVAIDLNPAAVKCAVINVRRYGLESKIRVAYSDLFGALAEEERFDLIVCNPPFFRGVARTDAELAFMAGPGFEWLRRFSEEAKARLLRSGSVVLSLSDSTDLRAIIWLFKSNGWHVKVVARRGILVETLYIFRLSLSQT